MTQSFRFATLLSLVTLCGFARAQTGTLDQSSPIQPDPGANENFNATPGSLEWQQQVRVGQTGQLEGFILQMTGQAGASVQVSVRMAPGPTGAPAVYQAIVTKPTFLTENVFVNVTSANIQVTVGTVFVIEIVGQGSGAGFNGSHVPSPGTPMYSEPLFLNNSSYDDGGHRLGFRTYVLNGPALAYCAGDGTGAACPCGNTGAAGHGCANSVSAGGAQLAGSGNASISNDTLVITGSAMPNSSALYFQGTQAAAGGAGVVFGDGLRCAAGTVVRLGTKTNTFGASSYPGAADPHISIKGANTAATVREYQCWYRNAAVFCTPLTFNLTNGVQITWTP